MWFTLMMLTLAVADEASYRSCCIELGAPDCPTYLEAAGPGSRIQSAGLDAAITGVWALTCGDGAAFFPVAQRSSKGSVFDGALLTPMSDPAATCFDAACRLPENLCLAQDDLGTRIVDCRNRAPASAAVWSEPRLVTRTPVLVGGRALPVVVEGPDHTMPPTSISVSSSPVRVNAPPPTAPAPPPATPVARSPIPQTPPAPVAATTPRPAPTPAPVAATTPRPAPTPAPVATAPRPTPTPAPVATAPRSTPTPAPVAATPRPTQTPAPVAATPRPTPTPVAATPRPTPTPVAATPRPAPAPPALAVIPPRMDATGTTSVSLQQLRPAAPDPRTVSFELPANPPSPCVPSASLRDPSILQLDLGDEQRVTGDLAAALGHYRAAITVDPCNSHAWAALGSTMLDAGNPQNAEIALANAVQLKPDNVLTWSELGRARESLGQWDEAIAAYHEALVRDEGYAPAEAGLRRATRQR